MTETLPFEVPTCVMPALGDRDGAVVDHHHWHSVVAASLTEAERLLDQSERSGYRERALVVCTPGLFVVRWR